MHQRRIEPEEMDSPELASAAHDAALRGLARLNRTSGVAGQMYRRLRAIARGRSEPLRVLDVATGSGDLPIEWLRRAGRDSLPLCVTGLDVSPHAVAVASARAADAGVAAEWRVGNALEDPLPAGFDVVTCSLFMHHLQDDDVVRLLRAMRGALVGGEESDGGEVRRLLVCDLVRSRWNLAAVAVASRLLSRSPVVHRDAILSVRAAMTRREFAALAEDALGLPVRARPLFPCRFISEIDLR